MIDMILNYWLELLMTTLVSGIIFIFKQYIGLKNGLKDLLRTEIIRIYETYSKLGYCPSYMKENVNEMYISYHRLKGNGMVTTIIKEIYKLPSELKEVKNEKSFK